MSHAPSTFVRALGQGAHKALALHCTIAHSGAWSGLAAALNGRATLIAPDMLSHGNSPDWDGQGDYYDLVTQQAAEQLTEPMDVIGHSFGAMVALRLAIEHPDLVRSVVLIEPVFFAIARLAAPNLLKQHDEEAQPYKDALAAGDFALAARLFNRMWSTEDSPRWPDLPERTRTAMVRGVNVVAAVEGALFDDDKGLARPEAINKAAMPILILCGTKTHPVMPAVAKGLQRLLPDASCAVVEGAGHMLPITHPSDTARLVVPFWKEASTVSA